MIWKSYIFDIISIVAMTLIVHGEDESDQWMYFVDDKNGSVHIMNYTSLPTGRGGFIFADAQFLLYTRNNPNKAEELHVPKDNSRINSTFFNSSNDIRAITHGWLSGADVDWVQNIKNGLLEISDSNVILIDWSGLADNPIYPWSALCTRYVGKRLAKLLKALATNSTYVHLIGHSLGAQVMGYTGMFYEHRVQRITGLDPARPLFELPDMGKHFRLDPSDADTVDIVHTCGGRLGYKYSQGDIDFYPNNGVSPQPGCDTGYFSTDSCSHARSHEYFYESLFENEKFYSYPCQDWKTYQRGECTTNSTLMGYPTPSDSFDDYYLYTKNATPYAI